MQRERRGRIVHDDGRVEDVPEYLLDEESIIWPPGMPVKRPGEPTKFVGPDDFYRRHEIVEGFAYLFLNQTRDLAEVSQDVVDELIRSIG